MTRQNQRIDFTNTNAYFSPPWLFVCVLAAGICWTGGCRTLLGKKGAVTPESASPGDPVSQADRVADDKINSPIAQVSAESPLTSAPTLTAQPDSPSLNDQVTETTKQVLNMVTGREQEDSIRAKELYGEADILFRSASSQAEGERFDGFLEAAELFEGAAEAAPRTALEQDALFMQAESLFFAEDYRSATEIYQTLQKRFPRNRHIDRVAARLFSISDYWINRGVSENDSWMNFSFTDDKRPIYDMDGHAIRVLDQIRFDDPTGRLADDATMRAASEYLRQQKYAEADEFLTDLRETFPDSEHLFLAHMLGIQCKLELYAGPAYSGLVLEDAEKLVQQTRDRFPEKMQDQNNSESVAKAAAEIAYHRAGRYAFRAKYRERQEKYGAARVYYNLLLQEFPNTPQAETARVRLAAIEKYPDVPKQRLSWLQKVFPDQKRTTPLETTQPSTDQPETKLR
ncbi:tetratricopeptide repeat protein [Rhodopirellula sp.]|nr:tetratricopeptide repeat protein [bacterium]MDB4476974.1 tetratricopeptide repeat protein [Rhodopirellula sp.]